MKIGDSISLIRGIKKLDAEPYRASRCKAFDFVKRCHISEQCAELLIHEHYPLSIQKCYRKVFDISILQCEVYVIIYF